MNAKQLLVVALVLVCVMPAMGMKAPKGGKSGRQSPKKEIKGAGGAGPVVPAAVTPPPSAALASLQNLTTAYTSSADTAGRVLGDATGRIAALAEQLSRSVTEKDALDAAIPVLNADINVTTTSVGEKGVAQKDAQKEFDELTAKLKTLGKDKVALDEQIAAIKKEIDANTATEADTQTKLAAARKQLASDLADKKQQHGNEVDDLKAQIKALEDARDAADAKGKALKAAAEQLEKDVQDAKNTIATVSGDLEKATASFNTKTTDKTDKTATAAKLDGEVNALKGADGEIARLTKQRDDLANEIKKINADWAKFDADSAAALKGLKPVSAADILNQAITAALAGIDPKEQAEVRKSLGLK